jgi:hypothetical protein
MVGVDPLSSINLWLALPPHRSRTELPSGTDTSDGSSVNSSAEIGRKKKLITLFCARQLIEMWKT